MPICQLCSGPLQPLIDFGPQPVCNRYLAAPCADEFRHPLLLSQCPADGLLQLADPWPSHEVRPRFDWISYKEPERHLDDLCERIAALPGVEQDTLIAGLSYKDAPVLSRLETKGFKRTWQVGLDELGIREAGAGMETIQDVLTVELGAGLSATKGAPGVVVVRHLLEHSNSLSRTMGFLKAWVRKGGYLILEVPDSEQTFRDLDFGTIWEEHTCYFSQFTLERAFGPFATETIGLIRYPYSLEDCLIAIVANSPPRQSLPATGATLQMELERGAAFKAGWQPITARCHSALESIRNCSGSIVIYGAGHRATTFVNLLGLEKLITCAIDDDPRKAGLRLPGCQLPIVTSRYLRDERPTLCLLAASPDSETAIVLKNQAYVDMGGQFASIYPRSLRAWTTLKT